MIIVTLSEKVAVVSGGETFYGKILVGNSMRKTDMGSYDGDAYQINATGFISIIKDMSRYNIFKNNKVEWVNVPGINIEGVQVEVDLTGVPI